MERYRVPDTQRIHWVSGPVFFLNRTFSAAWNIRYPDTSLKRGVSRPVNVLIFLDLPRIMECRWWTLQFLPFFFTKIPRYGLCYPNLYSKRSRHVKILFRRMRWNSTIREASSVFSFPKFHGTWNTRDSNTTGIPRFMMKLPMLKSWQNSLIRENCTKFDDTFNFHAWYWKKWYRLFTPLIPHDMFPGQHWTSLHFRDLFVGVAVLYWKWFLTVPTILPFLSPPQSYSL